MGVAGGCAWKSATRPAPVNGGHLHTASNKKQLQALQLSICPRVEVLRQEEKYNGIDPSLGGVEYALSGQEQRVCDNTGKCQSMSKASAYLH